MPTPLIPELIPSDRKLAGLHGLRAIAALTVVLFHLKNVATIPLPPGLSYFIDHFYLSVQLFFVLSAFSLFHSHICSPVSLLGYFGKRFFRIAPLFYLLIAFQVWFRWRSVGFPGWRIIIANLTFSFNLFPGYEASITWAGWSVGVEMLFYIMLPGMLFIGSKRQAQWPVFSALYLLSTILAALVWNLAIVFSSRLPANYAYYSIFANLAPFSAGLLGYSIYLNIQSKRWLKPGRIYFAGSFFLLLTVAFIDPLGLHYRIPGFYFAFWSIPFGILCLWQSLYPSSILQTRPMQWLADRSFSIYLLHFIVIEITKHMYLAKYFDGIWLYVASLAATLPLLFVVANITYRWVELPGISIGRKLFLAASETSNRPFVIAGGKEIPK